MGTGVPADSFPANSYFQGEKHVESEKRSVYLCGSVFLFGDVGSG
jgi:hypothetical protein